MNENLNPPNPDEVSAALSGRLVRYLDSPEPDYGIIIRLGTDARYPLVIVFADGIDEYSAEQVEILSY